MTRARPGVRASLESRLVFYGEVWRKTLEVGSFTYTTRAVGRAVAAPLADLAGPRRVLEVGAGTGALTWPVVERLGPGDTFDVYEINPSFARLLREQLAGARGPTIRVFADDIERLPEGARYDAIVSSLPWMNLEPVKVERILALYEARLVPGGIVSSWDYFANGARAWIASRRERARLRAVLGIVRALHERHEYRRRVIPWNVPPACVHWSRKALA